MISVPMSRPTQFGPFPSFFLLSCRVSSSIEQDMKNYTVTDLPYILLLALRGVNVCVHFIHIETSSDETSTHTLIQCEAQ